MKHRTKLIALLLLPVIAGTVCFAQWRGWRRGGGSIINERYGVPEWTNAPGFEKDSFSFARVRYTSGGYGSGGSWNTDYRDADLNLSLRLSQLTSMQVNPEAKVIDLTDPDLFNYPFIYIVEPGRLTFSDAEVTILRKYLLNGGFLMVDDFWGRAEYFNFYEQIKRVFPEREPVELPPDHPIFHCVFDLKTKPQIPGVHVWLATGLTYEREDATVVEYKAIFDDKGRIMVIICHNTDLGDGWEEEATNPDYFREFSEKYAYPLAINIFFYTMTH
jgi:Domain of unknown function (DUF4159)